MPYSISLNSPQRWINSVGLAIAVGIAYFLAARLSLVLLTGWSRRFLAGRRGFFRRAD